MERVTNIMVKRRYFPSNGTVLDVAGMVSAKSKKKTIKASNTETESEICNKSYG